MARLLTSRRGFKDEFAHLTLGLPLHLGIIFVVYLINIESDLLNYSDVFRGSKEVVVMADIANFHLTFENNLSHS